MLLAFSIVVFIPKKIFSVHPPIFGAEYEMWATVFNGFAFAVFPFQGFEFFGVDLWNYLWGRSYAIRYPPSCKVYSDSVRLANTDTGSRPIVSYFEDPEEQNGSLRLSFVGCG